MEKDILADFLNDKDLELGWTVCQVDNENFFYCQIVAPTKKVMFCFVPSFSSKPYIAVLSATDLENQCQDQGFVGQSILLIQKELHSPDTRSPAVVSFQKRDNEIELCITLSNALNVLLKATIIAIDEEISFLLIRRLLGDVLKSAYLLQKQSDSRVKMLHSKDRALDFFTETLEELGDKGILGRWAPKGSVNYQALERYEENGTKESIFGGLDENLLDENAVMETADSLFELKRDFKNFRKSSSNLSSPSKWQRKVASSDFAPSGESLEVNHIKLETSHRKDKNVIKLEATPSLISSAPLASPESPTASRGSSESPGRKRKFRRVRITKE